MNNIISALGKFVLRDVCYIFAGLQILASFLVYFPRSKFTYVMSVNIPDFLGLVILFLLVFASYVIGFSSSELASFWITPKRHKVKSKILLKFYNWRIGKIEEEDFESHLVFMEIDKEIRSNYRERLERTINHKTLLKCAGTSTVISSLILAFSNIVPILLSIIYLLFGIALIFLSWIKAIDQMSHMSVVWSTIKPSSKTGDRNAE